MKITRPVGVNKDGYASGGVEIETSFSKLAFRSKISNKYQRKKLYCSR